MLKHIMHSDVQYTVIYRQVTLRATKGLLTPVKKHLDKKVPLSKKKIWAKSRVIPAVPHT